MKNVYESKYTKVISTDEPALLINACHNYEIWSKDEKPKKFTDIKFQDGPIMEFGANGCQNEDLIAVVIDRLEGFQNGEFTCCENKIALDALRIAQCALHYRTKQREERGVEGKLIK